MAQTLEQHKAAVLAANPTPVPAWYLHSDHPGHPHDDIAVARCVMDFNGGTFVFEVNYAVTSRREIWSPRQVEDPFGPRGGFAASYATWTECKAAFILEWEDRCQDVRDLMAAEAFAREVLAEAGITDPPAPVFTSATATLAGIVPNLETLSPAFDADTPAYACNTASDAFLVFVTLGFAGQTVFWKHGHDAYVGTAQYIRLDSGENVISITVVSADGQNVKTYTLTVTVTR